MKKFLLYLVLICCLLLGACRPSPVPAPDTAAPRAAATGTLAPTQPAPQPITTDTAPVIDLSALSGLPFDQFVEDSFKLLLLRDPEAVTIEGLSKRFGLRNDQLTDLSDAYVRQTQVLQRAVYDLLHSYDRATLSPSQQVTYDTYAWYLDDLIRGQDFMYNDYPVNQMYILGQQYVTMNLFTEFQPLETLEDAQAYLARLGQVRAKFDQLIESLYLRQQAGIVAPRFVFEWSLGDVQGIANTPAERTSFYQTFYEQVNANPAFSEAQKDELYAQAREAIDESVLPAYRALAEALLDLMQAAPQKDGVWQYDNGAAYYAYALRHFTSTELSAEAIHQLGLSELERIHGEMDQAFAALGYDPSAGLRANYNRLAGEAGLLSGESILQRYTTLVEQASQNLDGVFERFPQAEVVMGRIPSGAAFYSAAALDGSRPGVFYAPVGGQQPAYNMATVAYHEAVPGHQFQIALQREMDLPLFRNLTIFNGYAEGWALYAERLVWELGWYADDPYGNLGRLQYAAHRAARLVVDTGLHTKQWTFDQAVDFMVENTGLAEPFMQSEVARYIVWPGQAASYYIGYLKLLELRQQAQEQLGAAFDLAEFHSVVLGAGSVPLEVLEGVVEAWLAGK